MSTLKVDTIQGKTTAGTVAMPAGHVVQFLTSEDHNGTTVTQNQATGFVDVTGFSQAITPKFSTSKIFVHLKFNASNITAGLGMDARLMRDSTEVKHLTNWAHRASEDGNISGTGNIETHVIEFVDTPSSTSAITYKIQLALRSSNAGTFTVNDSGNSTSGKAVGGTMYTLIEIAQ
tara:strand:+ start:403 stop:930 length:528 start_codon:yes stop_codon:yes gene_type:complete